MRIIILAGEINERNISEESENKKNHRHLQLRKNITSIAEPMEVTGKKESDPNKTLDEADTKTDKGSDDEHFQQGLSDDAINKRPNPADSSGNERGYIGKNSSHGKTSLHTDEALNEANTETDKGNDNESLNQRIGSDSTDKGTDPSHGRSNHATRIGENSSESASGRSRSRAYHLSNIFAGRYIQTIWIKSRMIRIVRIAKAKPMK